MTRNIFIFLSTFVVGAVIALIVRAAAFKPNPAHEGHPAPAGDYAPLVSNALAPAKTPVAPTATPPAPAPAAVTPDPHANHGASAATPAAAGQPVNTVCAICGMDVDPDLPTLEYKGQTIGFGCRMCPPKFKADPDRYGPHYLKNEVIKR